MQPQGRSGIADGACSCAITCTRLEGGFLNRKNENMSDEQLRLLIESMENELLQQPHDAAHVVNVLAQETVKFRDKLKEETGEILTVRDTRVALEALTCHLNGQVLPEDLTPEQKALTRIWIDRLTIFEGH